ncbi:hypothetical protein ACFU8I_33645 [Streptomyces sp. NPDC057540]|uniref:hypothetical protein n=1 Tax=Streptomyces sp. NPDC057540 TaxID=3346160 RepID=UPI0036764E8A
MIFRRTAPIVTGTFFTASLAVGVAGWATSTAPLTDAGLLGLLAAVPLMYWVMITRTHEVTDEQIAQAEARGYVKALDHVGRGIVDVPVPPSPGLCEDCGRDLSPADVVSLNARRRPANNPTEENRAVP